MFLIRSVRVAPRTDDRAGAIAFAAASVSWSLGTMWLEERSPAVRRALAESRRADLRIGSADHRAISPPGGADFYEIQPEFGRSSDRTDPGRFRPACSSGSRSTMARATCWCRATASRPDI